ncbi:nucleotidyltransferase family protein [Methylomonas sp. SURF-2]|uniref:Nucleotidyltransferase family protein n=1 Tax=Methylomonas subterranea TaxID=2952225 RepID=A0ABT1TB13_9GAMM|nr:nucleotidyltransferase family protein [Methylomonas sp. SURF-2]MCQ8102636.1 nucleotidyltransferase family protein [Methylomonas sp. SURF-2]
MRTSWPLLVAVLRKERAFKELNAAEWDLLIRQARRSQLLGHLYYLVDAQALLPLLPNGAFRHLDSARVQTEKQQRDFLWEIGKLRQAFTGASCSLIVLKGGAYTLACLAPHRGRSFSDIDLLVPFEALVDVEKRLMIHGWLPENKDDYDQQYYRRWMHEIPPLRHVKRGSVVDLHHNILPRTAKACPDAQLLLEAAVELTGEHQGIKVLSPLDRFIHSATHLFYEGELDKGLRDLVDLAGLIAELDADERLQLVDRARQLGLQRPVYYALRYLTLILHAPELQGAMRRLEQSGCQPKLIVVMDWLFLRALMPDHASCDDSWTGLARWLLYVRSHWLKMPLYLLLPHLSRKAWMRLPGKDQH